MLSLENTLIARESSVDVLRGFFAQMFRIRAFEERVAELVEAKEIRTPCHLCIGQEAVAAGVCHALRPSDYIWGGHRSHGHYLAKGGSLARMMAEIFGRVTGCSRGRGGSMHLFASEVGMLGTVPLVAATIPLAVGAGFASKLRADGRVSISFLGDGATEEGHFHESVNLAAVHKLPVVFVVENNFYASHMGLLERRREDNIVESARAHAIPGHVIDGNDVIAVQNAAQEAVRIARAGQGPSLMECRTFRWRGHVGPSWDLDVGVERKDELKDWLPKDPLGRVKTRLLQLGASEGELGRIENEAREEVERSVVFARQSPLPGAEELLQHVFVPAEQAQR